ncbi:hypothetical protein EDB86DRAFT_2963513 [Lactarius hatsudake]|nr:hypothetical protein EDB86DRAFT_2963513 [Lactarius hatsudake]
MLDTSRHASTQPASPAVPTTQPAAHVCVRRSSRCHYLPCHRLVVFGPTQMSLVFTFCFSLTHFDRAGPPAPATVTTSRLNTTTRTCCPSTRPLRHGCDTLDPIDPATTTMSTPPRCRHLDTAATANSTLLCCDASTSAVHLDPHRRRLYTAPHCHLNPATTLPPAPPTSTRTSIVPTQLPPPFTSPRAHPIGAISTPPVNL